MDEQIETLRCGCKACNYVQPFPPNSTLNVWQYSSELWNRILIDLFITNKGQNYFGLVLVDSTTK